MDSYQDPRFWGLIPEYIQTKTHEFGVSSNGPSFNRVFPVGPIEAPMETREELAQVLLEAFLLILGLLSAL